MIPLKIIIKGELVYARMLVGLAKGQMRILKRQRQLGLKDTYRKISPFPGVLIECFAGSIPERVSVTVTPQGAVAIQDVQKEFELVCICNCNFSTGVVLEETGEFEGAKLYSVAVCKGRTRYALFENVLASDFTIYDPGEKVILIPYNKNTFLCCSDGQDATGCSPLVSEKPFESDDWRATYRIIPWCGSAIPRTIEVEKI